MKFKIKKLFIIIKNNLFFIANHRILHEVNLDLIKGIKFRPKKKLLITTGIHRSKKWILKIIPFKKIGIQTEHLYNHEGKKINVGGFETEKSLIQNIHLYDFILDLNPSNKIFYKKNNINLSKVTFGPYIFPKIAKKYSGDLKENYLFFGSISNKERKKRVDKFKLDNPNSIILGEGNYGKSLSQKIKKCSAIFNIHHSKKEIYPPYPRILKCILYGKPFISEVLPKPFIKDKHYSLTNKVNPLKLNKTYKHLTKLVCKFNFDSFLKKIDA